MNVCYTWHRIPCQGSFPSEFRPEFWIPVILPWNDLIPTCVPRNSADSVEFPEFQKMRTGIKNGMHILDPRLTPKVQSNHSPKYPPGCGRRWAMSPWVLLRPPLRTRPRGCCWVRGEEGAGGASSHESLLGGGPGGGGIGKDEGLGSGGGDDASEGGEMIRMIENIRSIVGAREDEGGGGGKEGDGGEGGEGRDVTSMSKVLSSQLCSPNRRG